MKTVVQLLCFAALALSLSLSEGRTAIAPKASLAKSSVKLDWNWTGMYYGQDPKTGQGFYTVYAKVDATGIRDETYYFGLEVYDENLGQWKHATNPQGKAEWVMFVARETNNDSATATFTYTIAANSTWGGLITDYDYGAYVRAYIRWDFGPPPPPVIAEDYGWVYLDD